MRAATVGGAAVVVRGAAVVVRGAVVRRRGAVVRRHRGAAACRVAACWVTTGCRGWPRCGAAPPLCSGCARLRRCFRAVLALRSAGWCVAAALGTVVCRSFPSLGFVGAPTILSHFSWWRSLFGSTSDEAVAGFRGRLRLALGRFVGPVRRVAHTNPHLPPRTLTNPHTRTPNQEHPFRNTSHTCTSVRVHTQTWNDIPTTRTCDTIVYEQVFMDYILTITSFPQ